MLKTTKIKKLQILFLVLVFTCAINAQVGIGTNSPTAQLTVTEDATFNESGGSNDFRIESDNSPNMFFIDGTNNRLGINTASPVSQLQFISNGATGWITQWDNTTINGGMARFQNTLSTNGSRVLMGSTNYNGTALQTPGLIGLALNGSTISPNPGSLPPGSVGVNGHDNNEDGIGVLGTLSFAGSYGGYAGYFNADIYLGGGVFGPSDRRLKRDINPINNALLTIQKIKPVSYYYDTEKYPGVFEDNKLAYGFIAQEIENIIPEMVKETNIILNSNSQKKADMIAELKTEKFKSVNYMTMIPILTKGIQEQQTIIESQNKKIKSLEKRMADIEAKVISLLKNKN